MADLTRPDFGEAWASEGEKLSPDSVKIKLGWVQEMMPYQFENFLQSRQDEAILYLLQKGVPEYSPTQEYTANKSVVVYQGNLYMATSTVTGVLPTVAASWKRVSPTTGANGAVAISSGGTGATSVAEARTNLGLGTASTANLPSTNGVVVRSADNTLISRILTGTSGNISITNPDGVTGNININVGTNVAQLDKDSSWISKGGITLPKGSSGDRGVEVAGKIRYNTELQKFEGFDGTSWNALGADSEVEITTLSGDGITTSFTLNTPAFSESSTDVYIGGVYQNKGTYSVSGSTITFSEAPTPGTDNIQVVSRRVVDLGIARASQVSIEDTANKYTATTVEGALREITEYEGKVEAEPSWDDVPKHKSDVFNAQAQALANRTEYSRNRALRKYIDVADYVSSNDEVDVRAAVQAALNDGAGRDVVFTNPIGGSRIYKLLDRSAGGLTLPGNTRVIFEDNAFLDCTEWGRTGDRKTVLRASGSISAIIDNVVSDLLSGGKTIQLSAGAGAKYSRGDHLIITSNKQFGIYAYDTEGEIAEVASVSGDVITIVGALHANYLLSDSPVVRKIDFVKNISVEGLNLLGAGRRLDEQNADSGLYFDIAYNTKVIGANIKDVDFNSIVFKQCYDFELHDYTTAVEAASATTGAQYGVAIVGASMYGVISSGQSRLGRHAVAWTDQGIAGLGVGRHITIRDVVGVGQIGSSFTTHTSNELCEINYCKSIGSAVGCDIRVPNMRINTFTAQGIRTDSNLQYGIVLRANASNLKVNDFRQYGGRFGIASTSGSVDNLVSPNNLIFRNSEFLNLSQRAIDIQYSTAEDITGLDIRDIYAECPTTTIRLVAKFKTPIVKDTTSRYTAGGTSPGSAILFQNCKDIYATNNLAISYTGSVLIQNSTGTHISRDNDII